MLLLILQNVFIFFSKIKCKRATALFAFLFHRSMSWKSWWSCSFRWSKCLLDRRNMINNIVESCFWNQGCCCSFLDCFSQTESGLQKLPTSLCLLSPYFFVPFNFVPLSVRFYSMCLFYLCFEFLVKLKLFFLFAFPLEKNAKIQQQEMFSSLYLCVSSVSVVAHAVLPSVPLLSRNNLFRWDVHTDSLLFWHVWVLCKTLWKKDNTAMFVFF